MEATLLWAVAAAAAGALLATLAGERVRRRGGAAQHAEADVLRAQAEARDERLARREETLDAMLASVREREARAGEAQRDAERRTAEARSLADRHTEALERVAGLTAEQARRELLAGEEEAVRRQVRRLAADLEAEAREHAEARARGLIATAVQRLAVSTVSPATTVAVPLPEGDMKARIIGKEGRNIRTFEERTGVNVVIDDVPDAVLLSSFEPRRREVARVALSALIADGRIYPTTIEEQVALAEQHVSVETERAAIDAATDARVYDLSPELVESLGELYVRTSYGQNVLQHSVEVAHLAGMMAQELGVDADLARRAGLLHDIGKARGQDEPGSHAAVGARLAARIGEPAAVCHAIEAHHGEVEPTTPEAVLVQVADQISLSRPGGPREPLEQHMTRMRAIEELCRSFDGVERVHAMQAGRDIRVMVSPQRVGDEEARELARSIATRVESELAFPGRVAVTVVRELRATEFVR